jgi:hypothetical protein
MCPRTTLASQRPCSGTGWCMRRLSWSLIAFSLARIRFEVAAMVAVSELVSGLDAELVRLGYKPSTMAWYRGCWRRLERFFASRGVQEFSLDLAMTWVDGACGGFFEKEQAGTLKPTDLYLFRDALYTPFKERSISSTLLGRGEGGGEPFGGDGLAAQGAGAEDEGEHDLQLVQDLVEGHPGAGT